MSRWLRYLRIAFSATCAIVCVLLVVLWVRSFKWEDQVGYCYANDGGEVNCRSVIGRLEFGFGFNPFSEAAAGESLNHSLNIDDVYGGEHPDAENPNWGFFSSGNLYITAPHWSLSIVAIGVGTLPWLRFSLRTLLIVTTLVAVVLGAIVYAAR